VVRPADGTHHGTGPAFRKRNSPAVSVKFDGERCGGEHRGVVAHREADRDPLIILRGSGAGLQDGRGVGMSAEFFVVRQSHTVGLVFWYLDGGRCGQEPVVDAGVLGNSGQFGGAQPVQEVGDGGRRGVRAGARVASARSLRCS
jgi:hypothetical protein